MSYQHQGAPDGGRRQAPPYPLLGTNGAAAGRAPAAGVYGMPQYGQVSIRAPLPCVEELPARRCIRYLRWSVYN